jgi:prevent-host-death family protein
MHSTYGAQQITSVTELRQDTNDIIQHAERTGEAVLVQRNNEPVAVLLGVTTYERYLAPAGSRASSVEHEASEGSSRDSEGGPKGLPASRQSFVIVDATMNRARNMAYWEHVPLHDVLQTALETFVDAMEAINGEPYPPRRQVTQGDNEIDMTEPWAFHESHFDELKAQVEEELRQRVGMSDDSE